MGSSSPVSAKEDQDLMAELWSDNLRYYPDRAVLYGMPWGVRGTPLEHRKAPRKWQIEELKNYGEHIRENVRRKSLGQSLETYQFALCSGRGPGKSALYGMISWFHMSCWPGSTTIAAANGEPQLDSKTFPEIKKWFTLAINSHWFDLAARSVRPQAWFKEALEKQIKVDCGYYYVMGQLWTEEKPDAFAGAHNPLGIVVLFDEASGIPGPIWTVTKGFFTEPCVTRAHFAFSNGRRNTGPFFECFHKMRNFWKARQIDCRDVAREEPDMDIADLLQIIHEHGEESDEAKIEVRGMFPAQGDHQLIGPETVDAAVQRLVEVDVNAPLIIGVDVARFGEDKCVIAFRQGRDAESIRWQDFKKISVTQFARHVANAIDKYDPDAVMIDGNGVGGGVVDILTDWKYNVIEVQSGSSADEGMIYANKRTEMWCNMADWLKVGRIPAVQSLKDDLTSPEYLYKGADSLKQLEPKEKTKKRGFASPDFADALAMTFAQPVGRRDTRIKNRRKNLRTAKDVDYDVLG